VYCISATVLQQLYYSAGDHRWTPKLEEEYQQLRTAVAEFLTVRCPTWCCSANRSRIGTGNGSSTT
jgi:hypothetical protein